MVIMAQLLQIAPPGRQCDTKRNRLIRSLIFRYIRKKKILLIENFFHLLTTIIFTEHSCD